jgi:hypothetical protein
MIYKKYLQKVKKISCSEKLGIFPDGMKVFNCSWEIFNGGLKRIIYCSCGSGS